MLPRLPAGTDVEEVRVALDSIAPRAELRRWALAWRAHGNSAFRSYREDVSVGIVGFLEKVRLSFDQRLFLEHCRRAVERTDRPYWEAREEILAWQAESMAQHPPWAPISAVNGPDYAARFELTARLEAELLLARGTLLAHQHGIDRALAWSHEQTDPFDGAALRSRVRADGVLELWSVGPNGLDEGGRAAESTTGSQDDVAARWIRLP